MLPFLSTINLSKVMSLATEDNLSGFDEAQNISRVMPEQERQKTVRTNSKILSCQTLVECRQTLSSEYLRNTIHVVAVHSPLTRNMK